MWLRLQTSRVEHISGAPLCGRLLSVFVNIRLGWKGLQRKKTLAYLQRASVANKKVVKLDTWSWIHILMLVLLISIPVKITVIFLQLWFTVTFLRLCFKRKVTLCRSIIRHSFFSYTRCLYYKYIMIVNDDFVSDAPNCSSTYEHKWLH